MEWLLAVILILGVVTLVGHGLWVLFAAIYRRLADFSEDKRPAMSSRPVRPCPRCGLPLGGPDCRVCRWPMDEGVASPRPAAALDALAAQIETLWRLDILDSTTRARLTQLLDDERRRLTPAPQASSAAPQAPARPREEIVAAEVVAEPLAPGAAAGEKRELASRHSVAQRAAAYAARREQEPPPPVAQPAEPARSWADWLAAFMEERNIRWGELVGGLLIVCGSIALVVSFWSAIAERPWLKFLVFGGVTAALFGVGFYSEHRWRLKTTSQGLLSIACLLVPLNFLAIAAFSSGPDGGGLWTVVGELCSAALFAALVFFAGRVLVPRDEIALAVGVLVPSLAQLLVRRFIDPAGGTSTLVALAALPAVCYLAVNLSTLRRVANLAQLDEPQSNALLRFLGLTSFAVVLPIALVLYKSGDPIGTLRQLPALGGLIALVPLCAGLTLWQKCPLAAVRTAGTSVAIAGALVALVGLVAGWPEPGAMLPAALVDFAIFTFVAWRFGMPAAHLAAAPCLALASLLAAHLASGRIELAATDPWTLARVLVSGPSGVLLAPLVLAYLGAAFVAWRRDSRHALAFAGVAVALAAVSVALVSWFGFALDGDPLGAAWVYLLYAACFLTVAARHRHPALAWTGAALLLAATVQAVVYHYREPLGLEHPYVTALLGYCTLVAGIAAGTRAARALAADSPLADIAWQAAFSVSLGAALGLVWLVPTEALGLEAWHWAWLAGVWLAVALATRWLGVWTMFQAALVLATVFATSAQLHQMQWFADSPRRWLDPWTVSAVAVALVGLNLCWAAARITCQKLAAQAAPESRAAAADRLLALGWLSVDRVTSGVLVAVLVGLGVYAAAPGVLVELSPRNAAAPTAEHFQWLGIPHAHAGGLGSWALLAGLLVLLAATLRRTMSAPWLACMFITAAVSAPLVASRFESETAVASALVWCSAGMLAAGSAAIWARRAIAAGAARLGWPPINGPPRIAKDMTALTFALALIAPAAIAATIGVGALTRTDQLSALASDGFIVAIACIVTLAVGGALAAGSQQLAAHGTIAQRHSRVAAAVAIVLGIAPLLALVVYHVGRALVESPIRGPDPASIFYRMGPVVSYAAPILVTALVLVGYAMRERSSAFGLAGGLVTNAGASVAWLLATAGGGLTFDAIVWLRLAQLNAAVAAIYTLAWVGLTVWDRRRAGRSEPLALDLPCSVQAAVAPAVTALALGGTWARLVQYPEGASFAYPVPLELADVRGWLSFALVCASVCAAAWAARRKLGMLVASAFLVALAVFAAGIASHWDVANWLAYNTLFVGHAAIAALLAVAGWYARRTSVGSESINAEQALAAPRGAVWTVVQAAAVVLLALREIDENIWWTAGGLAYVGTAIAPLLAWIYQRRRYLYIAAPLVVVAGLMALVELNWLDRPAEFVYWLAILLAVPVPLWLAIELAAIRRRTFRPLVDAPPAHRVATRLVMVVLALVVGAGLWRDWIGLYDPAPRFALDWLAVGAALVAALACLWDAKGRDSVAMLYALGLVACGLVVCGFNLAAPWLLWTGAMVLAAYALATSYLWSRRRGLAAIAAALGVPLAPQTELAALNWLVPANLALVSAVVLMTFAVELTSGDVALRVLAAQATLVQVVSLALLARGDRRGVLQLAALELGAVGAVMLGWSWLEVGTTLTWLHALVVVAAATGGVAALYGLGLNKLLRDTSDWLAPARRITPWLAGTSAAAIVATLAIELVQFNNSGAVAIAPAAILVVAVTLAAMSAAALAAAVLPGRDPLSLSERGRTIYVYAAEILLALLFVHVRVTMPWLFRGFFQQFWPLVVMAIAYLGVGFAELFRRRNMRVLAEPLENTGALLPVLPVLGYWATDSRVDYSLLLLCVGVLYTGLSIARRSFGFGVLAALAANGGLWFFLGRQDGLSFLRHPQVWLIPPAVCVLAAAYLNRRQLSEAQMTAIRYFSSMAIYLSSTADIFVNGVANAPWLPLVLAGLSILGILAGIVLRVRAFLFLGTSFLALALFTIIWHAAVDLEQTWIWYASVVIVGLLILATFAMFEKKRQEVLDVFERIKQWEA